MILQQNKAIQTLENKRRAILVAQISEGKRGEGGNAKAKKSGNNNNHKELGNIEKKMIETKRLRRYNELCLTAVMFQ